MLNLYLFQMLTMSATYNFILPQVQVVMPLIQGIIPHLEGVYAYSLNWQNEHELYMLNKDNSIETDPLVLNANEEDCHVFCKKKQEIEWCSLTEIPFLLPKLQASNKHHIANQNHDIPLDIMQEAERTNLCIRIHHPYDNQYIVYVICFRKDFKHWDNISVQNKEGGLNQTNKHILQSMLPTVIKYNLDNMHQNSILHKSEQQINADMLKTQLQTVAMQREQLKTLMYRKAKSAVPNFFDIYTTNEEIDNLFIKHLDHPVIKDVFTDIHRYMQMNIHDVKSQQLLDKNLCATILQQHIDKFNAKYQTNNKEDEKTSTSVTINKDILPSRKDKIIDYLDLLEQAAEILMDKEIKITAKNLINVHPHYKDEKNKPSTASISMYLQDEHNKRTIANLFKADPENTQWTLLREHFLNLHKLDKQVKEEMNANINKKSTDNLGNL